jgi:glycosyltransferase involved in cell wall biosynthesis
MMTRGDRVGHGATHVGEKPGICVFTETYHPVVGGGETQARLLTDGLQASGWPVCVLTRRSDPASVKSEHMSGVGIFRVPPSGSGQLKKWMLVVSTLPALLRLRREYDLFVVSGFRILGIPALLVSLLLRKACVLKADSLGEMSGEYFTAGLAKLRLSPSFPLFRLFLSVRNRLLRRARAFVAVSSQIESELVGEGVDPEAIERIPNGVDTGRFRPVTADEKSDLRARLNLPPDKQIVVFTGRLVSYKGLPLLLQTWQQIPTEHPDALLLLVGGGGLDIHNCEEELKEFVRDHDLEESVVFTGEVSNVHEYLQAADIFVFPTENEAFGISLVEAMACGLPAVSTTVGGLADILRHEENGLAVPVGGSPELGSSLHRLLSDRALGERLGRSARETAVASYSAERIVGLWAELAERLLGLVERESAPMPVPPSPAPEPREPGRS